MRLKHQIVRRLKKPDPGVYKNLISKLNVDPRCSIAIEDTPNGLRSTSCAGLRTIVTVHEMTKNLDFPEAVLVVDSVGTPQKPFKLIEGKPLVLSMYQSAYK